MIQTNNGSSSQFYNINVDMCHYSINTNLPIEIFNSFRSYSIFEHSYNDYKKICHFFILLLRILNI